MDAVLPLAGRTIVITRPKGQAANIVQRLESLGARVVEFPLLAIEAPSNHELSQSQLSQIDRFDCVIFTSRNAVNMTFKVVDEAGNLKTDVEHSEAILARLTKSKVAAVGRQTADALERHGVMVSIVPEATFNSEALLEHANLQNVTGQRIAIIRGEGGRDLLRHSLSERGAEVEYIDVYRRRCPVDNLLPLVNYRANGEIDIIALTSVEGLTNLFTLGVGQMWLRQTTLLVGSQRMASVVEKFEHQGQLIIADDPSDDQMINCLVNWARADL